MKTCKIYAVTAFLAFVTGMSYGQLSPTNGLLAFYPFNRSGTNEFGSGPNLLSTNVQFSTPSGWGLGPAAVFDGRSSYCIGDQALITGRSDWTWCGWVFCSEPVEGDTQPQGLYEEGLAGGNCFGIGAYPRDGILEIGAWNVALPGNWKVVVLPVQFTNRWNHIVISLSGGGVDTGAMAVFVNGLLATNTSFQAVAPQDSLPRIMVLGNGWWNASPDFNLLPFRGVLDQVRIYDRALSSVEVVQIYGDEAMPRILTQPSSQVGYWGKGVTFTVKAGSPFPLSFQWYKEDIAIPWATSATLPLNDLSSTDAASYKVSVSNDVGSVISEAVSLIVNPAGVTLGLYPGITIDGVAGRTYGIQYVTDLRKTNDWTTIKTLTLGQPTELWIDTEVDVTSGAHPKRFYRVVPIP
jgi:hypothetical protein